jgi:RNA recognition motif-containing protein
LDQERIQAGILSGGQSQGKDASDEEGDAGDGDGDANGGTNEPPTKKVKTVEETGFFQQDEKTNCFMYVQGLPIVDFDEQALFEFMKKAGVIAEDDRGEPKLKLYRNSDGSLKGDGRVCYLKVESVSLAMTILDGSEIAPGFPVSIARATFEAKVGVERKKKPKKKKQQKETQAKKLLSWHEEKGEVSKKASGVLVIKNMFDIKQFDEDADYFSDIQNDLHSECSKYGEIKKIMIFDRHPEGVVSIKFTEAESAHTCLSKMHNRIFDGRKLHAEMWDGHTNYKIEESDAERDARRAKWEADLEKE